MMEGAVLIVDDEKGVLSALKRVLFREGYDIHLAENGPAALEILETTEIAAIICDQRMPGMSGAEVLAEAYRIQPDAVRITLTGHTDLLAAQASINEGRVTHFLFKPWNDDHLRQVVRQSVEAYRLVRENRRLESLTRRQNEELQSWNRHLKDLVRKQTEGLEKRNEDLAKLHNRVDRSLRDTVKLLTGIVELQNPNQGIHCRRVAELASRLGVRLGLDDESLRNLEFAAQLHDIGKLTKIATKGSLMRRVGRAAAASMLPPHTEAGFALLSSVSGFEEVALAVRHLREHYDGSGRPAGLKWDEIPLASRILAVANGYDNAAFSPARPTRLFHQAGCDALREGRNSRFDPDLVDLMLDILDKDGPDARGEAKTEVEISSRRIEPGMVLSRPVYNVAGLLMLKEGTRLTPELIDNIEKLGDVDPRLDSVFVECEGEEEAPSSASEESEAEIKNRTPRSERSKILVVDDSEPLCNALKRELRPAGIDVVATDSGWTALEMVEETRFDAALVDLLMPAMPGDELVSRLRRAVPDMPCIILTGNATKERVLALAHESNVAAIMVKPWQHDRLVGTIAAAVAKGRS